MNDLNDLFRSGKYGIHNGVYWRTMALANQLDNCCGIDNDKYLVINSIKRLVILSIGKNILKAYMA
jgi:hypothetical protein